MASTAFSRILAAAPRRAVVGGSKRGFSAILTTDEEFPGLPSTTPTPSKVSSASVTALPNGLTVVSEDASATTTVALTFPKGGSADESISEAGAALANKCLAFKSGSGLSSAIILRNLEDDGATPFATAGRSGATVGFTASPDKAIRLIPLLVTDCTFEKWDVKEATTIANEEVTEANSSAQVVLKEQIFSAAYGAQTVMGRPYYTAGATASSIASFRDRTYGMNGAVLAATGIQDHEAFVRAVQEGFSEANPGTESSAVAAAYMGGEARIGAPSMGYAHVALAFEGPTATPLLNVLKHCINLSSAEGVSAFATTGLLGVYGGAESAGASSIVDSLCSAVGTAPSAATVERAKSLAKAEALFSLDGGSKSLAESMSASVLETGTFSASGISEAYDSITAQDVSSAFASALGSNPAMASVGEISSVPYHATVAARFS